MREHTALKIFIGLLAAVFLIHQFYSSVYKPITTESAVYYKAVDGLNITGVIIRNESYVTCDTSGTLHFVTSDGSRVAKNGAIADLYDSASASVTVSQLDEINSRIADLQELMSYNDHQAVDLDLIGNKVSNALGNLVKNSAAGDYSSASADKSELISALNHRKMITGEQTDFTSELETLKSQAATLSAALPAAKGTVKAAVSGYFVSSEDGYESVLTCDSLDKITPEFLADLSVKQIPENAIGKIVSDYEWYIAARVSLNDSLRYKEGDLLTISTRVKSSPELPVAVKQINISNNSDSAVVIFSCQVMNSELAAMRTGSMTVVSKVYSGLKLPKKALRVVEGKTGVYVLSGISLKFVPVTVIYSTDEDIICEQQQSTENVLRLYDEVVVKGKKLYDGKITG